MKFSNPYASWGGYPRSRTQFSVHGSIIGSTPNETYLPYGCGRSYGDVCLSNQATLLQGDDHTFDLDESSGLLTCTGATQLRDILHFCLESGWMVPGVPGTQNVSVGGMIANDVHGKDHHRKGCIGSSIVSIELLRSDGDSIVCSEDNNPELFRATIGGLGLTGYITKAVIQLRKVPGMMIEQELVGFSSLQDCVDLITEQPHEYAAAVINLHQRNGYGHGIVSRGSLNSSAYRSTYRSVTCPSWFQMPAFNRSTARLVNSSLAKKSTLPSVHKVVDYRSYFFPYDRVQQWNRLYGRRGFLEYHCVTPHQGAEEIIDFLKTSQARPVLTAVKVFSDIQSPGLLSFPKPGTSLLMDFLNTPTSLATMEQLDHIVQRTKGRIYPAKDARMPAGLFKSMYPDWQKFLKHKDPNFTSNFWERVTKQD